MNPSPFSCPEIHLWERSEPESEEEQPAARVKAVQRDQLVLHTINVEQLVGPEHLARMIWELVGQRNLQPFHQEIKAVEGKAGRSPHDPRLMISLWCTATRRGLPRDERSKSGANMIRSTCG